MTKSNDRFQKIYQQSTPVSTCEIWVDAETGVQYLYRSSGNSGGLTPLLGRDGKPLIADQVPS